MQKLHFFNIEYSVYFCTEWLNIIFYTKKVSMQYCSELKNNRVISLVSVLAFLNKVDRLYTLSGRAMCDKNEGT